MGGEACESLKQFEAKRGPKARGAAPRAAKMRDQRLAVMREAGATAVVSALG